MLGLPRMTGELINMRKFEKLSRKYKYRMKQKYNEDPFAFLILWSLFFSAVFLIFAFRGFIATFFMHQIDVADQPVANEETSASSSDESPADETENSAIDNSPEADNTPE